MTRLAAVVTGALVLASLCATAAEAKGPNVARVCGETRCTTIRGETAVWPLLSWQYAPFTARGAPSPAPFYSFRLHDPAGITWVLIYVPRRHAIRIWQSRVPPSSQSLGPYWRTLPASAAPVFRRAVRGLAPHRTPRDWRL